MLGWSCEPGCDCLNQNHIHHDGSLHPKVIEAYNQKL